MGRSRPGPVRSGPARSGLACSDLACSGRSRSGLVVVAGAALAGAGVAGFRLGPGRAGRYRRHAFRAGRIPCAASPSGWHPAGQRGCAPSRSGWFPGRRCLAVSALAVSSPAGPRRACTCVGGRRLAGPGVGGRRLGGRRLAGPGLAGPGLAGTGVAGLGQAGRGLSRQSLAGLGVARPQLAGPGQVSPVRAAGLRRIDPDQPRGRGDREQPGDHYDADDQRPAIRPPTAGQPGVFRPRLIVGLGANLDQPQRPGILGYAGGRGRLWRGRAVVGSRPGLGRGQLRWCGLIRLRLIRLELIRLALFRVGRSGLAGNRMPRRPAAGLGVGHVGLEGDDRERTRMPRGDRGGWSLSGQGSRRGHAAGRRGIRRARAVLSRRGRFDRARLNRARLNRARRGHTGRPRVRGGTDPRPATCAEPQHPADRGSASGAESHRRQPSLKFMSMVVSLTSCGPTGSSWPLAVSIPASVAP